MWRKYFTTLLCVFMILFGFSAHASQVLLSGTCTRDNTRLSTINGTAFWECNGLDISDFVNQQIEIRDSGNKIARGFCKAVGAGTAYGSDKDVDGITKANPGVVTLAASSGIIDGMCVYFHDLTEMTDLNTKYRTVKGTSGDTFQLENTSTYAAAEATGGNCVKQLTVPSATGCVIKSTYGGTTENWSSIESGFNVNDSSGYSWRIISTNIPGSQVASGSVTASNVKLATVDGGSMVEITGVDLSPYAGVDTYASVPPTTNLQLWLKADAGCYTDAAKSTACASDADKVYVWADQSGNGNDAVQATEGNRPLWKTNIVGTLPAIRFDGSNDYIKTGAIAALETSTQSIYAVVKSRVTPAATAHVYVRNDYDSGAGSSSSIMSGMFSNTTITVSSARASNGTPKEAQRKFTTSMQLLSLTWNGTTSFKAYFDGKQYSGNITGANAAPTTHQQTVLGIDPSDLALYPLDGDIYEILIYNVAHDNYTRSKIERYLAGKWNIAYQNPTTVGAPPAKYLLCLYDSSNRVACGYAGAAGAGEALAAEKSTGTCTAGKLYKITATEANHFYTGCAIGEYFTSAGTETCDANNKVQEVTEVEATGLHLHGSANNTNRNLWLKTSGFSADNVTSYKAYRTY